LAAQQRQVRKRAFIHKYGLYAHIQRRFDAPIPNREPQSEPEDDDDDEQDLSWGPVGNNTMGPMICDYDDPFFKRR
jgi:hypothetical protein